MVYQKKVLKLYPLILEHHSLLYVVNYISSTCVGRITFMLYALLLETFPWSKRLWLCNWAILILIGFVILRNSIDVLRSIRSIHSICHQSIFFRRVLMCLSFENDVNCLMHIWRWHSSCFLDSLSSKMMVTLHSSLSKT